MLCDIMLHAMIIIDPEANSSNKGRADAALALSALRLFLRRARKAVPVAGQVSVLLASDSAIKRLNGKFRGKNRPTDVISFPALEMPYTKISGRADAQRILRSQGTWPFRFDAAARQAQRFGHPVVVELKILMLHGLLHLAGYDHETDAGEMAAREEQLRRRFRLPTTLIARTVRGTRRQTDDKKTAPRNPSLANRTQKTGGPPMTILQFILILLLLAILTLASYVNRLYSEMGKFLAREFQENIDVWEQQIEPRLGMTREHAAQSASILTLLSLASLALVFAHVALHAHQDYSASFASSVAQTVLAIVLTILLFHEFLPQLFFTRTRGQWVARLTGVLRALFYLMFPITLVLGFLLSIAALAESDQPQAKKILRKPSKR